MSRYKWTIRNYNTYLREFKRTTGASHKIAQAGYRAMRGRLGRPVYGVDVKRHPRMTKDAFKVGIKVTSLKELPTPTEEMYGPGVELVRVTNAEQWLDSYDEWIDEYDYDDEEWESTADYEETPA